MSWFGFGSEAPPEDKFHPVHLRYAPELWFGKLAAEDLEWAEASGIATETQTFYTTLDDGALIMCQIIHASIGFWYPNVQFTFRYVNQTTGKHIWKSVSVSNFAVLQNDRRSMKSDNLRITYDLDQHRTESFHVVGTLEEVDVNLKFERIAEGWKLGSGPQGGLSYYGGLAKALDDGSSKETKPDYAAGRDGFMVHRFWPRCKVSGSVFLGNHETAFVNGDTARGCFVSAIQGMRPNLTASRWNFADFQGDAASGTSLVLMEFTTAAGYERKSGLTRVTVGSIVVDDKLVAVCAGGSEGSDATVAAQFKQKHDNATGYDAPQLYKFQWTGPSIGGAGNASAAIDLDVTPTLEKGLVEKVDVLGHIPYAIKAFVSYAAQTSPFIYTYLNKVSAKIDLPTGPRSVEGSLFNEATFIS